MTIKTLTQIAKMITDNGMVHVRWCRGAKLDAKMGGRSLDAITGRRHAGLSAVDLNPDAVTDSLGLARRVAEYGFTRIKDERIACYIITGAEVVGKDSDGYDCISGGEYHKVDDGLMSAICDATARRNKITGCTYGNWSKDQMAALAELEVEINAAMPL